MKHKMTTSAGWENSRSHANLVLRTKDTASRGRMLREADLTLDKAIIMCLTSERTSSQLQKLEHDTRHTANSEQAEVKYVNSKGDKAYKPRGKHPFKGQGKKQQKTVQSAPVDRGFARMARWHLAEHLLHSFVEKTLQPFLHVVTCKFWVRSIIFCPWRFSIFLLFKQLPC